jgi:DNA-binding transcriptional LysR family regulator
MTYEQLQAFLAVASRGTFSAASQQLHKSQPAVSKLVRNLEDELGLLLFDRAGYRPALTEAGQMFCERAAAVIEGTESLRSFAFALAGRIEPVVRLVLEAITPLAPLMTVLREVQRRFPAVRIELRTERMAGVIEALKDRSADLVVASRQGLEARTMEAQRFTEVRILPVARHDHPLARAGAPVPAALLRQHAQVVLRDSARGELPHNLNLIEGGLRWAVTDLTAKLEILQAGMGWGGMPEHMVAPALTRGTLVVLDVREFDVDTIELFTMRRRDRPAGTVAQALWAALAAPAPERPKPRARRSAAKPPRKR